MVNATQKKLRKKAKKGKNCRKPSAVTRLLHERKCLSFERKHFSKSKTAKIILKSSLCCLNKESIFNAP